MPARRFLHSLAVVLSGGVVAQVVPVLTMLVLTRLLAPAEYGSFAVWFGLLSLVSVFLTGRLELALALEPEAQAQRLAVLAILGVLLAAGLMLTAMLAALWPWLTQWHGHGALVLLGVPAALLTATSQVWQDWAAASSRFQDLARMRVALAVAVALSQMSAALIWPSALGLAAAQLLGLLLGVAFAFHRLGFPRAELAAFGQHRAAAVDFLHRRRRFIQLALPANAVNNGAAQLPLLLVGQRFGPEMAGYLALALRALGAPISLIGSAVLDVLRRPVADTYRRLGQCRALYMQAFRWLAGAGVLMLVLAWPLSETLFVLAFGERWRMAGVIARWLLPLFALRFAASPLSYMFYVADKQQLDLVWQLALLGTTALSLTVPSEFRATVLAYAAGYGALYVLYLLLSYRLSLGSAKP